MCTFVWIDDLELLWVIIFSKFCRFWRQLWLHEWR